MGKMLRRPVRRFFLVRSSALPMQCPRTNLTTGFCQAQPLRPNSNPPSRTPVIYQNLPFVRGSPVVSLIWKTKVPKILPGFSRLPLPIPKLENPSGSESTPPNIFPKDSTPAPVWLPEVIMQPRDQSSNDVLHASRLRNTITISYCIIPVTRILPPPCLLVRIP